MSDDRNVALMTGKPDDIAVMVHYLMSPHAGFITGQNIVVDGGMVREMVYEG